VLAEIKRDGRTPSTPSLFATLFGRRLIYAASLALLLLACGLALQHFRHAANESQQEMAGDRHETREQQQPQQANVPSPSPQIKKQENVPQTVLAKESPRKRQRLSVEPAAEKQRVVPRQTDSARIENTQIATVPGATATVGSTNAASQSAPEVSRIEIQTADPNIRIIWLTPQKSEAPNPEKDNHENGDRK
jgi:hypothetical protein